MVVDVATEEGTARNNNFENNNGAPLFSIIWATRIPFFQNL
jgi:hypothetical protein